ncbi:glycosyltransferase family 2 protein [Alphaproteobacteria bacterium]|nr:glycosyltransferase family 2 protein [Alphaproteobacteria bacterium]
MTLDLEKAPIIMMRLNQKYNKCTVKNPLVSCAIFVFNGEKNIARIINDISNQTYQNLEICISDNNSDDNTRSIIKQLSKKNSMIRVVFQTENKGPWLNAVEAIRLTKGDYVFLASVDDKYDNTFVEELLSRLKKNQKSVVAMCATALINEEHQINKKIIFKELRNPLFQKKMPNMIMNLNSEIKDKKYNFFIYGLYKKEFLTNTLLKFPEIFELSDRLLPLIASLIGPLEHTPKILFNKTTYDSKFDQRHAGMSTSRAYIRRKSKNRIFVWIYIILRLKLLTLSQKIQAIKIFFPFLFYLYFFQPAGKHLRILIPKKYRPKIKKLVKMP